MTHVLHLHVGDLEYAQQQARTTMQAVEMLVDEGELHLIFRVDARGLIGVRTQEVTP